MRTLSEKLGVSVTSIYWHVGNKEALLDALVERIRASGLTVLIVEQNVRQVLRVVDRAYLLEAGNIKSTGAAAEMLASGTIQEAYLGI